MCLSVQEEPNSFMMRGGVIKLFVETNLPPKDISSDTTSSRNLSSSTSSREAEIPP